MSQQAIESLAPRIKVLAESFRGLPSSDVDEKVREKKLER